MAQAVTRLFPGAKFSIGPAIENGFYYDFELPDGATFSDGDLERIESEMREIIKSNQPFVRSEMSMDTPRSASDSEDGNGILVVCMKRTRPLASVNRSSGMTFRWPVRSR